MKASKIYAALWMTAALPLGMTMGACSDDDGPSAPSREIVQLDIYQAESDAFALQARYKFTYDGHNRLTGVRTDFLNQEVAYTHGTNSIAYRWEGNDPDNGGLFVTRFEAELRNGRVQVGSAQSDSGVESQTFNYAYYYNAKGYITDATFGGSQSFSYQWGNRTLVVQGRPSTYDAEYNYSTVDNNYSIDLNAIPLFVDGRADVMMAMNTYAQLAGALGTPYPYFLEDTDYAYTYHYDTDGRLVQIVQTPSSLLPGKQQTWWFVLGYAEE